MGRLQDKIAIVTGGGTGIGRAIALGYARERAMVVIANRTVETGQRTADEIANFGGHALFVQTDIRLSEDIDRLVRHTM